MLRGLARFAQSNVFLPSMLSAWTSFRNLDLRQTVIFNKLLLLI